MAMPLTTIARCPWSEIGILTIITAATLTLSTIYTDIVLFTFLS